jgi:hypothetical protein
MEKGLGVFTRFVCLRIGCTLVGITVCSMNLKITKAKVSDIIVHMQLTTSCRHSETLKNMLSYTYVTNGV